MGNKNQFLENFVLVSEAKMILFNKWLNINYAYVEINIADFNWYMDKLDYFNNNLLPEYKENGTLDSYMKYIKKHRE